MKMNKNRFLCFVLPFFLILVSAGCKTIAGIKKPINLTEEQVISSADKLSIPLQDTYILDTAIVNFIRLAAQNDKRKINDHLQPLQAIYFSKSNNWVSPISWHINCYVPGFPKQKWNYNGAFNTFAPVTQAPLDTVFSLAKYTEYMRPIKTSNVVYWREYDFVIILYWNKFMEKQAKALIDMVKSNCSLAKTKRVKLLYVNNDVLFAR